VECYKDTLSLPPTVTCPACYPGTTGPCQNPYNHVCYSTWPSLVVVCVLTRFSLYPTT
jgi:hypothetical protein